MFLKFRPRSRIINRVWFIWIWFWPKWAIICRFDAVVYWWSFVGTVVFETNYFGRTDCIHCVSRFHYVKSKMKTSTNGAGSECALFGHHSSGKGGFRIFDSEDQIGAAPAPEEYKHNYHIPHCVSLKIWLKSNPAHKKQSIVPDFQWFWIRQQHQTDLKSDWF